MTEIESVVTADDLRQAANNGSSLAELRTMYTQYTRTNESKILIRIQDKNWMKLVDACGIDAVEFDGGMQGEHNFFGCAVSWGNVRVCRMMIEAGVDVNYIASPLDSAYLFTAVLRGHDEVCSLLIDAGAKVVSYYLSYVRNVETCEILIRAGADISTVHLSRVILCHDKNVVRFFIDAGADVNAGHTVDRDGREIIAEPPIHCACGEEGGLEICRLLVESGADIDCVYDEDTPLMTAIISRQFDIAKYLIGAGASLGLVSGASRTPFTAASTRMYLDVPSWDICRTLVRAGADPHERDTEGRTALHAACNEIGWSKQDIVDTLIREFDFDVNATDNNGDTPLHVAVDYGKDLIPVLLDAGANPTIANSKGETPIDFAYERGFERVYALLVAASERF
jgi:ankyrin repeat protein